jgi:hypothetical protein
MFGNKNKHDEKKNRSEDKPDPSVTTCRDAQFTEDPHQPVNLSLEGECNTSDQFLSCRKLSQYISLINPLNNLYKDWEKRVSNQGIIM